MTDYRTSPCRGCGKHVVWVQARCGKCGGAAEGCTRCHERGVVRVPLDPVAPVFVIQTDPERLDPESAPYAELVAREGRRAFVSHFATCPKASQFSGRGTSTTPTGEQQNGV